MLPGFGLDSEASVADCRGRGGETPGEEIGGPPSTRCPQTTACTQVAADAEAGRSGTMRPLEGGGSKAAGIRPHPRAGDAPARQIPRAEAGYGCVADPRPTRPAPRCCRPPRVPG